jgi:hypothetical protein
MYYYFFLTGIGAKPTWKKYVTQLQIFQFVSSIFMLFGNLYLHFLSDSTPASGCAGQHALMFNTAFNLTLLSEFVSIFGKGQKERSGKLTGADGKGKAKPQ